MDKQTVALTSSQSRVYDRSEKIPAPVSSARRIQDTPSLLQPLNLAIKQWKCIFLHYKPDNKIVKNVLLLYNIIFNNEILIN